MKINKDKAINDLKDSIKILEDSFRGFHDGSIYEYRIIAVQLRLLLCDRNPLIPRVFPTVRLHPLLGYITKEENDEWKRKLGHSMKEGLVFQMPAMVHFDSKGGSRIEALFDERKQPIELEEWLDQDLFKKDITIRKKDTTIREPITIRELIKSVANKEGAHSDPDYNETLKFTKSVKLVGEDIHIKFIVATGEYILKTIKQAIYDVGN